MPSFEHRKLVERITALNSPPENEADFASWLTAGGQLDLLRENADENELIITAIGANTFVYTVAVREDRLFPLNRDDLLLWSGNAFRSRAGYVWGDEEGDIWVEQNASDWRSATLDGAVQLAFGRQMIGDDSRSYFEVLQEYAHITDSHWRPEQHAYCRFDKHGDVEHVVSITSGTSRGDVSLVSFRREQIDQYLAVSDMALVRMFDFTHVNQGGGFRDWSHSPESVVLDHDWLFFRQRVGSSAAYTRGVQVIRPSRPKGQILQGIQSLWDSDDGYLEFLAHDWRNDRVGSISTDPSATTNYFVAEENSLPFETSAAFFSPDVLSKYKSDRDRYTISEERRLVECRGGWSIRYGINDANQVHVYIVDLRQLPFREQQYWKSFNEEPKTGLSERAIEQDFRGEWSAITTPLEDVLAIMREWDRTRVAWWKVRDATLPERVNTPRTSSRDEWADACQDLASLVIEGFEVSAIRAELGAAGTPFEENERSLKLLERLLTARGAMTEEARLDGLREVQAIRSTTASHARGSNAAELSRDALSKHGTYTSHFESLCRVVGGELEMIAAALT